MRAMFSSIALSTMALLAVGCGSNAPPGGTAPATDTAGDTDSGGDASAGDGSGTVDGGTKSDGGGAVDAGGKDGKSAKYACTPPVGVTAPKRNANCEKGNDDKLGCTWPWGGVEVGATKFSCNICRGGDKIAQGTWRFIDFDTESPATKLKYDVKQRLVVDGNTWHFRRTWVEKGQKGEITIDGWYFCSDATEQSNQDFVWVVTALTPSDAFGYSVGHAYSGSWKTQGKNLMAWGVYEGIHSGKHFEEIYCRVGSTIKTDACVDPFTE